MRPWLACTESKHRVKGLTSHETIYRFSHAQKTSTRSKVPRVMRPWGLTSHETPLRSRMHRKQAKGQGSHESREPRVSQVMRPYRVSQQQNASTGSRFSGVMRPRGLTSRESLDRVKGLTSHETLYSFTCTESTSTGSRVSRVMKPR